MFRATSVAPHSPSTMLLFILSVILLLFLDESLQKCTTTYITQCDSLEDIKKVDPSWRDIIVGSLNEDNTPSSKFTYHDIGDFNNVKSVTILGQVNQITGSISGLYRCNIQKALKTLIFYGNNIKTIPERAFPVTKLERFSLANNKIEVIEKNAFQHGPAAAEFDVSHNLLESIEELMFDNRGFANINSTKILDLSHNRISHIQIHSLPTSLLVLKLDYNKMRNFHKDLFQNMNQMISLTISNNQLYELPDLDGMVSLEILDLSRNRVEFIPPLTFAKLTNLRKLDLNSNFLYSSGFLSKAGLPNNNFFQLSIAFNQLVELNNLTDVVKTKGRLTISLFGNPWECAIWEKMVKTIAANSEFLQHETCDAELFSNGKTPYCINSTRILNFEEEGVQQSFAEAIAATKDLRPCKMITTDIWRYLYSCVY